MKRRTFLAGVVGAPFLARATASAAASTVPAFRLATSVESRGKPLDHYWSRCVGAGRANEGLRASWLEQLSLVREACGFQYCRFHGLFHDDMFVYRESEGRAVYNWQYIDDLFDRLLAMGVKPFVELGFVPKALASGEATQFWWQGQVSPPKDYAAWGALVGAFARHCIDRYGTNEVRTWYFEVWNEPNLRGFWAGTRSQYFELYRTSALAIKAVDPALRVGGPATSNFVGDERFDGEVEDKSKHRTIQAADLSTLRWRGVWIEAFLDYAKANSLPVDFVSSHPYPTDFALDPGSGRNRGRTRSIDATRQDLTWLRRTVDASAYPAAQIHLTEWSSSPSARDFTHDSLQAAAFILKTNLDSIGLANSLSYWTFTDVFEEGGAGNAPFHGGFGLVNYQGIVKPSFHAYRMLHALGDEVLSRRDGAIVTRHSRTGKVTALVYHYPSELRDSLSFGDQASADAIYRMGAARDFKLELTRLAPNSEFAVEQLDSDHGNAFQRWQELGSPQSLSRDQTKALRETATQLARSSPLRADESGRLNWSRTLTPWTCVLFNQL